MFMVDMSGTRKAARRTRVSRMSDVFHTHFLTYKSHQHCCLVALPSFKWQPFYLTDKDLLVCFHGHCSSWSDHVEPTCAWLNRPASVEGEPSVCSQPRRKQFIYFVCFVLAIFFAINILFLPMVQVGCHYTCLMKWELRVGGSSDGHC